MRYHFYLFLICIGFTDKHKIKRVCISDPLIFNVAVLFFETVAYWTIFGTDCIPKSELEKKRHRRHKVIKNNQHKNVNVTNSPG